MDTFMKLIVPIITAIAGFFSKMLIDYIWLRSPRLLISQKTKFERHVPIVNTLNSEFSSTLFLQVSNNSSNDAYNFIIRSIEGPTKMNFTFYIRTPTKPVTIKAGESHLIRIKFSFQDLTDNFFSYNLNNQMFMSHFATSTYVINFEYANALGKTYRESRQYGFGNDFEEYVR